MNKNPMRAPWDDLPPIPMPASIQVGRFRHDDNGKAPATTITPPTVADTSPPVPLDFAMPAPMPAGLLPDPLGAMIEAVCEAMEVPRELAAAVGLGAYATACARRFCVQVKQDYFEPLNLFIIAALPSGHRKSPTLKKIGRAHV